MVSPISNIRDSMINMLQRRFDIMSLLASAKRAPQIPAQARSPLVLTPRSSRMRNIPPNQMRRSTRKRIVGRSFRSIRWSMPTRYLISWKIRLTTSATIAMMRSPLIAWYIWSISVRTAGSNWKRRDSLKKWYKTITKERRIPQVSRYQRYVFRVFDGRNIDGSYRMSSFSASFGKLLAFFLFWVSSLCENG